MEAQFREDVMAAGDAPFLSGTGGRGIVTCAGGVRLFVCVYVLVRILRETLGCKLPIELWHFGGEEITPAMRSLLSGLDVDLIDATAVLKDHPAAIADGWQLKAYALVHSRFDEVLFLDADQVPVRYPAELFDWPDYQRMGAVFWPDVIDLRGDNAIWTLCGLAGETCRSWESGQILVDRRRHWRALNMALRLNERAEIVYRMIYGDKDTFLLAWRMAGAGAAVVPHLPFRDQRILVQRDFDGLPLFQHRTGTKWNYQGPQYEIDGFVHWDACLGFLADLRAAWNGRLFFPPDRSLAARTEENRLAAAGELRLAHLGDHDTILSLLPGHQIGAGRSIDRQNWYVAEAETGFDLVLHDGERITYRLSHEGDGRWAGERFSLPHATVLLSEPGVRAKKSDESGGVGLLVEAVAATSGYRSPADDAARQRLETTLSLLLQAEPGMAEALQVLKRRSPQFGPIVDTVLAARDAARPKAIVIDHDAYAKGYVSGGKMHL
ncbi:MAG: hypothetical protein WA973_14695 [Mesorhizobium sp.]